MLVGNSMNDDYYYPAWGAGGVYYGARPFYPPAYAYRPVYGGAFRPAYGYAPPAGYRTTTATSARTTMLSSTIRSTTTVSTTIRIFDQAEREVRSLPHAHHPATGRGNPHTQEIAIGRITRTAVLRQTHAKLAT
jgi:hypothetical protein